MWLECLFVPVQFIAMHIVMTCNNILCVQTPVSVYAFEAETLSQPPICADSLTRTCIKLAGWSQQDHMGCGGWMTTNFCHSSGAVPS